MQMDQGRADDGLERGALQAEAGEARA